MKDASRAALKIINGAGAWTALGASPIADEILSAMNEVAGQSILIDGLQAAAAAAAESTFKVEDCHVTACAASALVMAVAACLTRGHPDSVTRLPNTQGLPKTVVIQKAHCCDFGASIVQMVRMTGAKVREAGSVNHCNVTQLLNHIDDRVCAGRFVVSYEAAFGIGVSLGDFVDAFHSRGLPVIVDIAGQTDFHALLSMRADLYCLSVHKALGGPTAGLLMGARACVEAGRAHDHGICRPMKVGKEGIAGATAAILRWGREEANIQARWLGIVNRLVLQLDAVPCLSASIYEYGGHVTGVLCRVVFGTDAAVDGRAALAALAAMTPSVWVRPDQRSDAILISPLALTEDTVDLLVAAVKHVAHPESDA